MYIILEHKQCNHSSIFVAVCVTTLIIHSWLSFNVGEIIGYSFVQSSMLIIDYYTKGKLFSLITTVYEILNSRLWNGLVQHATLNVSFGTIWQSALGRNEFPGTLALDTQVLPQEPQSNAVPLASGKLKMYFWPLFQTIQLSVVIGWPTLERTVMKRYYSRISHPQSRGHRAATTIADAMSRAARIAWERAAQRIKLCSCTVRSSRTNTSR